MSEFIRYIAVINGSENCSILAVVKIKLNSNIKNIPVTEIEKRVIDYPEVIHFFRTSSGENEHILVIGFSKMEDLDIFINSILKLRNEWIVVEVIPFGYNGILKNSSKDIYKLLINRQKLKDDEDFLKELDRSKPGI